MATRSKPAIKTGPETDRPNDLGSCASPIEESRRIRDHAPIQTRRDDWVATHKLILKPAAGQNGGYQSSYRTEIVRYKRNTEVVF